MPAGMVTSPPLNVPDATMVPLAAITWLAPAASRVFSYTVSAAAPAPHKIAEQIYTQAIQTQMVVRYAKGEAMEKTLDWAAGEIEGFSRN